MSIQAKNAIWFWTAGSMLFGTQRPESDTDYIGVWVEPSRFVLGLDKASPVLHVRDAENGAKSASGDVEIKWYTLREFTSRALRGDVNILPLLWPKGFSTGINTQPIVDALHVGAIQYHVRELESRQKSIEKRFERDGVYDWKAAMHYLRVAFQASMLANNGRITMPFQSPWLDNLNDVRDGKIEWGHVVNAAKYLVQHMPCPGALPQNDPDPDHERVNRFLRDAYCAIWNQRERDENAVET